MKERGIVRSCQSLQEPRHLRRETIVHLIARSPQRVAAGLRQRVDLQHRVVGGDIFKGDVGMPADGGEATCVAELVSESATLLLLFAADYTDLVT